MLIEWLEKFKRDMLVSFTKNDPNKLSNETWDDLNCNL